MKYSWEDTKILLFGYKRIKKQLESNKLTASDEYNMIIHSIKCIDELYAGMDWNTYNVMNCIFNKRLKYEAVAVNTPNSLSTVYRIARREREKLLSKLNNVDSFGSV